MTYLALAPKRQLDTFAGGDATSIKWGSATNWRGNERVKRTEVDWLYDDKGVSEGEEKREQFFGLGREAWQQMEEMRVEWEQRLKDAGYDEGL
jgi:3-keto steroid reductase